MSNDSRTASFVDRARPEEKAILARVRLRSSVGFGGGWVEKFDDELELGEEEGSGVVMSESDMT